MMTNGNTRKQVVKKEPETMDYFEHSLHSPTDSSEDSVEVKISPISVRNKRKCAEPRKVQETAFQGPLKKRMCLKVKAENESHPFRPWSPKPTTPSSAPTINNNDNNFSVPLSSSPQNGPYFRPPSPIKLYDQQQDQPVDLIKKRETNNNNNNSSNSDNNLRVPLHPEAGSSTPEAESMLQKSTEIFPGLVHVQKASSSSSVSSQAAAAGAAAQQRREQRNYKNMTRERRIEANARERTRVHTISAAFDTLRKSIPSYSHNQKLSKLSVLRIACSYIMTLSNIVDGDEEGTAECVDLVTKTIQREGKLRKKKDDND